MHPNDEAFDELKNTRKRRRIGDRVIHMFVFHARHLLVTFAELMNHLTAHSELALWPESTLQQVMCPTSSSFYQEALKCTWLESHLGPMHLAFRRLDGEK